MVKEAEENKLHDSAAHAAVEAKNDLDAYAYQVANILRSDEAKDILDEDEIDDLMETVSDVMEWIEENAAASTLEFTDKKKQLKELVHNAISKVAPPPPEISVNECIFSPSGSLIEYID
jgi:heat shock protein 1/8